MQASSDLSNRLSIALLLVVLALPGGLATAADELVDDAADEAMSGPPASVRLPGGPVTTPMGMDFKKPAIEVTINGRGPFKLLVDTGASPALILNADLAAELGLERIGTGHVGDPSNPRAVEVALHPVQSFTIGGATFSDFTAIAWDRSTLYSGDDAPRGVVGFPLFHDVLVTFDYPGSQMRLAKGNLERGDHVVPFTSPMGVPEVPIEIGGKQYDAHLDSGSMAALMLPLELQDEVPIDGPPKEVGRARTVNSEFAIYTADFSGKTSIAGHPIETPTLSFVEIISSPNVGSQVLSNFAITFDQRKSLARFELPTGTTARVKRQRGGLGIQLGRRENNYVVMGTVPDSPADAADLKEGDQLVAVNGKRIADLPPGDMATEMRRNVVVLTVDRNGKSHDVTLERPE